MATLAKRRFAVSGEIRRFNPAARQFLAPQRAHLKQPMPVRSSAEKREGRRAA